MRKDILLQRVNKYTGVKTIRCCGIEKNTREMIKMHKIVFKIMKVCGKIYKEIVINLTICNEKDAGECI